MALHTETVNIRGTDFIYTYSDQEGYGVARDGVIYSDAYDPIQYPREYTEVKLEEVEEVES